MMLSPFLQDMHAPSLGSLMGKYALRKEDLAHLILACGDTANNGSLLLRQFVQTLTGAAFVWYARLLPPDSIKYWHAKELEFVNRFYSTQRKVSITELTKMKEKPGKSAADFLTRWRNASVYSARDLVHKG